MGDSLNQFYEIEKREKYTDTERERETEKVKHSTWYCKIRKVRFEKIIIPTLPSHLIHASAKETNF